MTKALVQSNLKPEIYLFIVVFFFMSCERESATEFKNDWERWNLKGHVKLLTEVQHTDAGPYKTTISFRKDGFVSEQIAYNPDKSLIRKWVFTYNTDRKEKLFCYIGKYDLSYTLTYRYDRNNNNDSILFENPGKLKHAQSVMAYDEKNRKRKETQYDSAGNVINEILFEYTDESLSKEIHHDAVIKKKWKQVNKYDNSGKMNENLFLSMQDSVLNRKTFKYNDGNIIETDFWTSDNKLLTKITYLNNGDESERIDFLPDGSKVDKKQEYKYDNQRNWTFMSMKIDDVQKNIVTREIQYYP